MTRMRRMPISEILERDLHLPEAFRNREARLSFGAMLYGVAASEKDRCSDYLFENVSLEDFTDSFFEDYLKTMFSFGYQLQPIPMKKAYTAVSLDSLVNNLLSLNAVELNKSGISKSVIFEKAFHGLYNSQNIEKYLKDFLYLPREIRDFHFQKDLFKLIAERSSINVPYIKRQHYATDYFGHCLVYTGLVLRKSKKQLAFDSIFDKVYDANDIRNKLILPMFSKQS